MGIRKRGERRIKDERQKGFGLSGKPKKKGE
jgi:hypothetical protein